MKRPSSILSLILAVTPLLCAATITVLPKCCPRGLALGGGMGSVSPARCVPIVPADGYDETDEAAFIRLLCANRRPFVMTSSRRFGRGRESVCGDARKGLELRWSPGEQIIVDY